MANAIAPRAKRHPIQTRLCFWLDRASTIARGFRRSAEIGLQHCAKQEQDEDILIYTILYSVRHYCELLLKSIYALSPVVRNKEPREIPLGHSLQSFLKKIMPDILDVFSEDIKKDPVYLDETIEAIRQIDMIDSRGDAFRYGSHPKGTPCLQDIEHIQLSGVDELLRRVSRLEGILSMLEELRQLQLDTRQD